MSTILHVHVHETRPAHWVIVLYLGLEGCLQPRELWFVDILMYVYTCTCVYMLMRVGSGRGEGVK